MMRELLSRLWPVFDMSELYFGMSYCPSCNESRLGNSDRSFSKPHRYSLPVVCACVLEL